MWQRNLKFYYRNLHNTLTQHETQRITTAVHRTLSENNDQDPYEHNVRNRHSSSISHTSSDTPSHPSTSGYGGGSIHSTPTSPSTSPSSSPPKSRSKSLRYSSDAALPYIPPSSSSSSSSFSSSPPPPRHHSYSTNHSSSSNTNDPSVQNTHRKIYATTSYSGGGSGSGSSGYHNSGGGGGSGGGWGSNNNTTITSINRSKSARTFGKEKPSNPRDIRRGSLPFVETLNLLTRDQLDDEVLPKYIIPLFSTPVRDHLFTERSEMWNSGDPDDVVLGFTMVSEHLLVFQSIRYEISLIIPISEIKYAKQLKEVKQTLICKNICSKVWKYGIRILVNHIRHAFTFHFNNWELIPFLLQRKLTSQSFDIVSSSFSSLCPDWQEKQCLFTPLIAHSSKKEKTKLEKWETYIKKFGIGISMIRNAELRKLIFNGIPQSFRST